MSHTIAAQNAGQPAISKTPLDHELVRELGLKEIRDNDALFESARDSFQRAARSLVESGVRFKQLKERLPHGEFEAFVTSRGFAPQRAREAMRAVDVVTLLAPDERKAMLVAPPSKLILLSRMKDKDLVLLAESGEFDVVIELPDSDLRTWIKEKTRAGVRRKLNAAVAEKGVRQETLDEVAAAITPDPRWLVIARTELLGNVVRARIELERCRQVVDELLQHENDAWEQARADLAHATRKIVAAVSDEATALTDLIATRFGAASAMPMSGTYKTLGDSLLLSTESLCAEQADGDLNQRARLRVAPMKTRGAPPKNLSAVLAQATAQPDSDNE